MDMLQVRGTQIVDGQGRSVRWRGTSLGGWMNMENFINGYPGAEHALRTTFGQMLGPAKSEFFFDRLLDHFVTEADIAFMRACGATAVRVPLNYRHFEADDRPYQYLEKGFQRLDRVLDWCGRHGLYAILDLHALQGWQGPDWHCDNASRHSLFWQHRDFQDRVVELWEEIARRYRGNATVAAYDLMNEPVSGQGNNYTSGLAPSDWERMNAVYRRLVKAIRAIDPEHIIVIEGDYFALRFTGLEAPFAENLVYSSHNYIAPCLSADPYPGTFGGKVWDRGAIREYVDRHEGVVFARRHQVPLWVGEFGYVYNLPEAALPARLQAFRDEIDAFEEAGLHWATWTYKDVGVMSWVTPPPESAYRRTIAPSVEAKLSLESDFWMEWLPESPARRAVHGLLEVIRGRVDARDFEPAMSAKYLRQVCLDVYAGAMLQPQFVRLFADMSEEQLDAVLQSWRFENCVPNAALMGLLKGYFARP